MNTGIDLYAIDMHHVPETSFVVLQVNAGNVICTVERLKGQQAAEVRESDVHFDCLSAPTIRASPHENLACIRTGGCSFQYDSARLVCISGYCQSDSARNRSLQYGHQISLLTYYAESHRCRWLLLALE